MIAIKLIRCISLILIIFFSCLSFSDTKVNFDGVLIEDACDILPGDDNIELNFGTIIDKYLYLNTRSWSQPFSIHLINCDLSVGKEVKVSFMGVEDKHLPKLLALDDSSQAKGVGIAINDATGNLLAINSGVYSKPLKKGNDVLDFSAYVQGEPQALANKNLVLGEFTATATFKLEYE